jgi:hypothetical protein
VIFDPNHHRPFFRALWAICLAGVVWGSLVSGEELSSLEKVVPFLDSDKLMHYGAYTGLAFLSTLALERRRGIAIALSMVLMGFLLELGQRFSPGRTPDFADALANTLGVSTGTVFGCMSAGRFGGSRPRRHIAAGARLAEPDGD